MIEASVQDMPASEDAFIDSILTVVDREKSRPADYDITSR